MIDINHMRKTKKTGLDAYEKVIHDFAILVMLKIISKEIQPSYIFSNHSNWKNGPWKNEDNKKQSPDIAIGDREKNQLVAAYEIESVSIDINEVKERFVNLDHSHIEIVIHDPNIEQAKKDLKELPSLKGFWIYKIDKEWNMTIEKDPENKSEILQKSTIKLTDEMMI